jgi:hypothetical protein
MKKAEEGEKYTETAVPKEFHRDEDKGAIKFGWIKKKTL